MRSTDLGNPDFSRVNFGIIDNMSGNDFELFSAQLLISMGATNVGITKESNDQGADIICTIGSYKYAVQCKRYSSAVGNSAVQESISGKYYYNCDKCAVITNNYYTDSAKKLARRADVDLWDRDFICTVINNQAENEITIEENSTLLKSAYNDCVSQQLNLAKIHTREDFKYFFSKILIANPHLYYNVFINNQCNPEYPDIVSSTEFLTLAIYIVYHFDNNISINFESLSNELLKDNTSAVILYVGDELSLENIEYIENSVNNHGVFGKRINYWSFDFVIGLAASAIEYQTVPIQQRPILK